MIKSELWDFDFLDTLSVSKYLVPNLVLSTVLQLVMKGMVRREDLSNQPVFDSFKLWKVCLAKFFGSFQKATKKRLSSRSKCCRLKAVDNLLLKKY